jgi:hypothetical protein
MTAMPPSYPQQQQPANPPYGGASSAHPAMPPYREAPYGALPPVAPFTPDFYPVAPFAAVPPRKSRRLPIVLGAAVAGLVLIGGGAIALVTASQSGVTRSVAAAAGVSEIAGPSDFEEAQTACDPGKSGTTVADGGQTLIVESRGEEDYTGLDHTAFSCIISNLNAPAAVTEHIGQTRAMDGRQTDTWDGMTASWTYHPDQGLDMIIRAA